MNADGGKVEKLEAGGEAQSPAWSPDGKEIAYAASFEGYLEIHVITLKNGKVRRLTEGLHAISPAWSPDGKQIAFIAYAHGSPEVYVMNDKGKKLQRLTTDSAADADPVWSPDGKRILFTSDRGGVPWLYTVRDDGSALNRLPLPARITGAHQGDWSRDGRIIFSLWGQTPATPAKMSADAPAPATLVYSPTPTPTEPTMVVMSAPEAVTGYNRTISYEYDSLYRLTGATYTEGTTVSEYAYGYDLRGNRTSVTAPGVGTFSYSYNLANQISYPGFTYDLNGNLTRDGYATYTYDAANRLRGVDTGVDATTYQYDGLGNRIGMTHNNVETTYLLDPSGALSQVLRETTGGVNTLYLHGLDIIGQQQGGTWTGFGYDPLGSVRFLLTNTGAIASRADYDPYGVPLPVPGQESGMDTTLGFTGEQTDPNDLVYLRSRYYNPRLGAFTSVDPVLGVGGSTGWNGYLYANGNPANLTDPSGECPDGLSFGECISYDFWNALSGASTAATKLVGIGAYTFSTEISPRAAAIGDWVLEHSGTYDLLDELSYNVRLLIGDKGVMRGQMSHVLQTAITGGHLDNAHYQQVRNDLEPSGWVVSLATLLNGVRGIGQIAGGVSSFLQAGGGISGISGSAAVMSWQFALNWSVVGQVVAGTAGVIQGAATINRFGNNWILTHNSPVSVDSPKPDWAQKGAHIKVDVGGRKPVELSVRPDHKGGIVFRRFFGNNTTQEIDTAIRIASKEMETNPTFVKKLYQEVSKGVSFVLRYPNDGGIGRSGELKFLQKALRKLLQP